METIRLAPLPCDAIDGGPTARPTNAIRPGTCSTTNRPDDAGSWWKQAACRGLETDLFFPERGESTSEAEAACSGCPVSDDCLWFALGSNGARPQRFGIWGGTSERQRRRLRHDIRAGVVS